MAQIHLTEAASKVRVKRFFLTVGQSKQISDESRPPFSSFKTKKNQFVLDPDKNFGEGATFGHNLGFDCCCGQPINFFPINFYYFKS